MCECVDAGMWGCGMSEFAHVGMCEWVNGCVGACVNVWMCEGVNA